MPPADPQEVTQLLADWRHGDRAALGKLTPLVYEELRRLAHHYMEAQRPDHTLQTTALVNEAYVRFADQTRPNFTNRSHFLAVAAKAMRQILVNHAKAAQRQKRGAGAAKVELDEAALISPEEPKVILDLHDALERLAALDWRKAQVVELSYFGGLQQRGNRRSVKGFDRDRSPRLGVCQERGCTANCATQREHDAAS